MKLIKSNGKRLEVRDVGPVIYTLIAGTTPIKCNGYFILEDEIAREVVRDLKKYGAVEIK
jgi:hypothetical protein